MKQQPNYYGRIVAILHSLKHVCPSCSMGKHLSTVIQDMGDLWAVSDRELFQELDKYAKELITDKPHEKDDIDRIYNEGLHLDKILIDDEPPISDEDEY